MKIEKIGIYKSRIKLKEPFIISLGTLTHAENIVVVMHTDTGLQGYGECSPFQTIHGETMETCFAVGTMIAKILAGKDPSDLSGCITSMDSLIYGNASIKSAFDIALFDIAAQQAGMPLYVYLGGNKNKVLQTDYTISLGSPEKMANDAANILANGFEIIKVKLGGFAEQDVTRIVAIRQKIGMEVVLRIDANQGWEFNDALKTLHQLSKHNIQHCEEPIARWDFMNLPLLRVKSPIPIMTDESCFDHHDALRLIDLRACHSFNVKLGKSGGIYKAQKIIALAEQAEMPMQMGGFLESRLGFTAAAHLALSSKKIIYFDFDTPLMFEEDPVSGGIVYGEHGIINVPEVPGLGASIAEDYLKDLGGIMIEA